MPPVRRYAPLLLAAAALGAYLALRPKLPHEHDIAFQLGQAAPEVTTLDVSWTDARAPAGEAALGSTLHFAAGTAPRTVHTRVRLPDGPWDVDIQVERGKSMETTRIQRRVNLDEASVMLPLEQDLR